MWVCTETGFPVLLSRWLGESIVQNMLFKYQKAQSLLLTIFECHTIHLSFPSSWDHLHAISHIPLLSHITCYFQHFFACIPPAPVPSRASLSLISFWSTQVKHLFFLEAFPRSCKQNWALGLVISCDKLILYKYICYLYVYLWHKYPEISSFIYERGVCAVVSDSLRPQGL